MSDGDLVIVSDTQVQVIEVAEDIDLIVVDAPRIDIVSVGEVGPPGLGASGAATLTLVADGALGGHRVVRVTTPGKVGYADASDVTQANAVLGITTGAASDGAPVSVQLSGELAEPSWGWTLGQPVFLGANGVPTQSVPTSGFVLVLGVPTAAQTLVIDIKQALVLG